MAYKLIEKSPYLIMHDHYNFFCFNTETGIITDRWGKPVRTNISFWNIDERSRTYKEWVSFFGLDQSVSADEIARQLYPSWKALAETGIILCYPLANSTLPNKHFNFIRAIMDWRFCIKADRWYIDTYYNMMVKQFFQEYGTSPHYENCENKERLFRHVLIYENLDDAIYLYNLILREGTLEFWADTSNVISLLHYCLEKHRHNEPLTKVRNLWNDYSKTLLGAIVANPVIKEIMEAEK